MRFRIRVPESTCVAADPIYPVDGPGLRLASTRRCARLRRGFGRQGFVNLLASIYSSCDTLQARDMVPTLFSMHWLEGIDDRDAQA